MRRLLHATNIVGVELQLFFFLKKYPGLVIEHT